jgi:hypothetical protein
VFVREGATWHQEAYVKASNTGRDDWFGYAVAIDGDRLAVGAYAEGSNAGGLNGDQSDNSSRLAGAVYLFTRAGATWSQQAYIKESSPRQDSAFGLAVALQGTTLVVSALTPSEQGTVFVRRIAP